MGYILLEGMEFFAFHGCFKEEQIIGSRFTVDLLIETDTKSAEQSDHLTDTVDYVKLYQCVKTEMGLKSHLLEHVAARIISSIRNEFPHIDSVEIKIAKMNPPIGGKIEKVVYKDTWRK